MALQVTDEKQKKALLLHYIGKEGYDMYASIDTGGGNCKQRNRSKHSGLHQ